MNYDWVKWLQGRIYFSCFSLRHQVYFAGALATTERKMQRSLIQPPEMAMKYV